MKGEPAILTLGSAVFVVNSTNGQGGGIFAAGGTVTGSGNNFTGNTADGDGGAIYANGANIAGVMANFALNEPNDIAP
ncbi:MAG: hypothetical protein WBM75_20025 [Polyangiales bacterium]